jgi:Inverse autotransporter, beta-domain
MNEYGMSKNYCDSQGRNIIISIEDDWPPTVIAKHNGVKIGHLEFDDYKDTGNVILIHADLKAEYHKAGIGTEMMKELIELDSNIYVPNFGWSRSTEHTLYYSSEGAAFIKSCIRKEIISANNIAEY